MRFPRGLRKCAGLVLVLAAWLIVGSLPISADVTISSFTAKAGAGQIKLAWTTATELKNWGFNVERSSDQKTWQHLGSNPSVKSQSPCIKNVMGAAYNFTDDAPALGQTYYYRLQMYGQPCGDPNTYHDQIVSAVANSPTATATLPAPATAPATPIAPEATAPPLTATALPSWTATTTRVTIIPATPLPPISTTARPSATRALPTQIAAGPVRATQAPPNPNAPGSTPPAVETAPSGESTSSTDDEATDTAEPSPAPFSGGTSIGGPLQGSDSRALIFVGALALAGLLGLGAVICAALAVFFFMRPNLPR
jgi:hypothetical protein